MNYELKFKILKKYGTQVDFAQVVGEREATVSRIVRGRRALPPERQKLWAKKLDSDPKELFAN